ncbi:MAG: glycosyltransferase, partial [Thaumarchaeota archaeon]|nr:glycosyltransferase [Nitrososphaerota archaeon]
GPTLPTLQKSVKQAHLEGYFVFTGSIPYNALGPYLMMSDLCVQLLNDWCMGTKVFMYMVHRRAVIAGGGWFNQYGQFLRNGKNSILIPPNVEVFAKEAVRVLTDSDLGSRLGRSAWETASPYTWDMHADETLRLLRASTGRTDQGNADSQPPGA